MAGLGQTVRETGQETSVRFVNCTAGDIRLFWLDASGQRNAYGTIAAGVEHQQHTYAGHVWLLIDAQDRPVAAIRATASRALPRSTVPGGQPTTGGNHAGGGARAGGTRLPTAVGRPRSASTTSIWKTCRVASNWH